MTSSADPTVAQDVAQAAAQDAGTAPADTISVACSLVRAGVFFDGTGNSRDHVPVEGVTWHTNVDLLERNYLQATDIMTEVDGQQRETSYVSVYMRGIGINADGITKSDWGGFYPHQGRRDRWATADETRRHPQDILRSPDPGGSVGEPGQKASKVVSTNLTNGCKKPSVPTRRERSPATSGLMFSAFHVAPLPLAISSTASGRVNSPMATPA